jgi:hypothetical protein
VTGSLPKPSSAYHAPLSTPPSLGHGGRRPGELANIVVALDTAILHHYLYHNLLLFHI